MHRVYVGLLFLMLSLAVASGATDTDKDGLPDDFEQELLHRFVPEFLLNPTDCDGSPVEFESGKPDPRSIAKSGTVYGQVFPVSLPSRSGSFLEIHYYHLWDRDCGLNGHPLDAEHVSVLLSAPHAGASPAEWKAGYWYAAAHEDTLCDAGQAARSSLLEAELRGAKIWVSAGKHASFLSQELCRGGCGGDKCSSVRSMAVTKLINLGELNAPANGADWIAWPGWPLADKMRTDFPEPVLARVDASDTPAIIRISESQPEVKTAVLVGGTAAGALIIVDRKTDTAMNAAGASIGASAKRSTRGTGNFIGRAGRALLKAFKKLSP